MKMVMERKPDTTAPPDVEGWYSTHKKKKPQTIFSVSKDEF